MYFSLYMYKRAYKQFIPRQNILRFIVVLRSEIAPLWMLLLWFCLNNICSQLFELQETWVAGILLRELLSKPQRPEQITISALMEVFLQAKACVIR